jgi:flagellar assembly protein FliH
VDALRERIADLARAAGFGGQVVLLGDPALQGSDARIEWAHGGAERNVLSLQSSIDEAVARFISSRRFD